MSRRLVLLVEGEGDFVAVPVLMKRLMTEAQLWGAFTLDVAPLMVGDFSEFESWLLAGVESLAEKKFPDGRRGVKASAVPPIGDLEKAPRDAKGWFRKHIEGGYNPTRDQADLTKMVDVNVIRQRGLRSFRRLENALSQLASAARSGRHIASPTVAEATGQ
jgi:hypothetical protein